MDIERWIENHIVLSCVALFAVLFVFVFGLSYMSASFEAAAYRKHCDRPVTAWDAMWLDLRIDECGS